MRIATRGSALARWQAEHVAALLGGAELVIVETAGDRDKTTSLSDLGGRGVFVKEVQAAVLDGRADVAVHSAKDLPSNPALQPDGLVIAAVPERADARDVLVGTALDDLAPGATIATGSARRRALLADLRPDLTFDDLRGNIDTRLAKVPRGGAVVMAKAALDRLDLGDRVADVLDPVQVIPQVGQGALALECRADDRDTIAAAAAIDHQPSRCCVDAERSWLSAIGGGCDLPAGAYAVVDDGALTLRSVLASYDGRIVLRHVATGDDAIALGRAAAEELLERGGRWLLQ